MQSGEASYCHNTIMGSSSGALVQEYQFMCDIVELPDSHFQTGQRIMEELGNVLQGQHPSCKVNMIRNWAFKMRNEPNNELVLFIHMEEDKNSKTDSKVQNSSSNDEKKSTAWIKIQNSLRRLEFPCPLKILPGFTMLPSRFEVKIGSQYVLPYMHWSGIKFCIVQSPSRRRLLLESQTCQLLKYMYTFDPRARPLLIIAKYWALANNISTREAKLSEAAFPAGMEWLVILFLCNKRLIPTPKEILERPHAPVFTRHQRHDVGFSDDPDFVLEWRRQLGSRQLDCGKEGTEEFITSVVQLAQAFFSFYGKLHLCQSVLNIRNGEIATIKDFLKPIFEDSNEGKPEKNCLEEYTEEELLQRLEERKTKLEITGVLTSLNKVRDQSDQTVVILNPFVMDVFMTPPGGVTTNYMLSLMKEMGEILADFLQTSIAATTGTGGLKKLLDKNSETQRNIPTHSSGGSFSENLFDVNDKDKDEDCEEKEEEEAPTFKSILKRIEKEAQYAAAAHDPWYASLLVKDFLDICKSVEVSSAAYDLRLDMIKTLETALSDLYPSCRLITIRNWYLDVWDNESDNDLLLYLDLDVHDSHNTSFKGIDKKIVKFITSESSTIREGLPGLIEVANVQISNRLSLKRIQSPGGPSFMITGNPSEHLKIEAQTCRLLKYLYKFDPRAKPLLILVYYWFKCNRPSFLKATQEDMNIAKNVTPPPAGLEWLVMLFLANSGLIPTPRQVCSRPHVKQRLRDGIDLGFSPSEGYIQEWIEEQATKKTNIPSKTSSKFLESVINLASRFFAFCGRLHKGNWVLNLREAEVIKRADLESGFCETLTAGEISSVLDSATAVNNVNECPVVMLNPFVLTHFVSFPGHDFVANVASRMNGTNRKLSQFLTQYRNNGRDSFKALFDEPELEPAVTISNSHQSTNGHEIVTSSTPDNSLTNGSMKTSKRKGSVGSSVSEYSGVALIDKNKDPESVLEGSGRKRGDRGNGEITPDRQKTPPTSNLSVPTRASGRDRDQYSPSRPQGSPLMQNASKDDQIQDQEPADDNFPGSEALLLEDYRSICRPVEISDAEIDNGLNVIRQLKTSLAKAFPNCKLVAFRNWYLGIRVEPKNELILFLDTQARSISTISIDSYDKEDWKKVGLAIPNILTHQGCSYKGIMKLGKVNLMPDLELRVQQYCAPTRTLFSIVGRQHPDITMEVQICLLLGYLFKFDPRARPLLILISGWVRANKIPLRIQNSERSSRQSPRGISVEWLVVIFLCQRELIPTPKMICCDIPHEKQILEIYNLDVGFISCRSYLEDFRNRAKSRVQIPDEGTPQFVKNVVQLAAEFFRFYGTFEKGKWVFNTREGKVVKKSVMDQASRKNQRRKNMELKADYVSDGPVWQTSPFSAKLNLGFHRNFFYVDVLSRMKEMAVDLGNFLEKGDGTLASIFGINSKSKQIASQESKNATAEEGEQVAEEGEQVAAEGQSEKITPNETLTPKPAENSDGQNTPLPMDQDETSSVIEESIEKAKVGLLDGYNALREFVEIPEDQYTPVLKLVEILEEIVKTEYPSCKLYMFRHGYMKLKNFTSNELLLFMDLTGKLSAAGDSCNNLKDAIVSNGHKLLEKSLSSEFAKTLLGPVKLIPVDELEEGNEPAGLHFVHERTTLKFTMISDPEFMLEVQTCRLLRYMLSLDQRARALLGVIVFWAKANRIYQNVILEERDWDGAVFEWLAMLFLCRKKIIPTPREIQRKSHNAILNENGIDIGFSPENETPTPSGMGTDEEFVLNLLRQTHEFFVFCSQFESDSWILNTRDGEVIKRTALQIPDARTRLSIFERTTINEANPKLQLVMTNPFDITKCFTFASEPFTQFTCVLMKETAKKLAYFLATRDSGPKSQIESYLKVDESFLNTCLESRQSKKRKENSA